MMIGWLRVACTCTAAPRSTMSLGPPEGSGTITRIGLSGLQALWAEAKGAMKAASAAARHKQRPVMIRSPKVVDSGDPFLPMAALRPDSHLPMFVHRELTSGATRQALRRACPCTTARPGEEVFKVC